MPANHDQLFLYVLGFPALAAAWLQSVLPAALVERIDWDTFAPAKERISGVRMRAHVADFVYSARRRDTGDLVWFVIEHKSYPDPGWHPQTLRYVVHLRRLVQKARGALPVVIATLVYHGTEPLPAPDWQEQGPFADFAPRLPVCLVDYASRPPDPGDAAVPPLLRLAFLFAHATQRLPAPELLAAIDRWGALLRGIEASEGPPIPADALENLAWYLVEASDLTEEQVLMAFAKHLRQPEAVKMTTGQRIRLESRAQGREEGKAEGRTEGAADTLLRLLRQRFGELPPDLRDRVLAARLPDLEAWTDRLLDAASLADVFAV